MKKLVCLSIVLCMVISLAGCVSSNDITTTTAANTSAGNETSAGAVTDPQPSSGGDGTYSESPLLTAMVKEGTLPAVEERLPDEPMVVEADEIGVYGGIIKGAAFGPTSGQLDTEAVRYQCLLTIEDDLETFTPNIIKDYNISDDFKEYTFFLREGMKWSNGDPLTADDFLFWYTDVLNNADLNPAIAKTWSTNGTVMQMTKTSDYEVKITFADPNPAFEIQMATAATGIIRNFLAPKKYLSQYHTAYNDKAGELAEQEGYDSWITCFLAHIDNSQAQTDVNAPDVYPWVLTNIDATGNKTFSRNPYYYKVDQAGNQLPYIDEQDAVIVEDGSVRALKLISGELHVAGENPLPMKDYTMYQENAAAGNYSVYLFDNTRGSDCAFTFNINTTDETLNKVFNDINFRKAMSLAVNRDEINQTLYYGKATVRQATASFNVSFMDDSFSDYMAEYDVDQANALLDESGYTWDSNHTVRLLPDGSEFNIVLETIEEFAPISEMCCEYWTEIGVKVTLNQEERTYYLQRGQNNERQMQAFTMDSVAEFNLRSYAFSRLRPGNAYDDLEFMPLYSDWFESNGASGQEPPENIKGIYNDCLTFATLSTDDPTYADLGKSILQRVSDQVWFVGISVAPRMIIISNTLGNTPTEGTFANDYKFWYPYGGDTWYFKDAA